MCLCLQRPTFSSHSIQWFISEALIRSLPSNTDPFQIINGIVTPLPKTPVSNLILTLKLCSAVSMTLGELSLLSSPASALSAHPAWGSGSPLSLGTLCS